jgi:glucan phosphoethanolaminetransferase (alkaline phosphatase superfamily)
VYFPFLAYPETYSPTGLRGAPTIFHETGWYWSAAYMVLIIATTIAITSRRSYLESVAALITMFLVFSVVTHIILYFAGCCYTIEGP